MPEIAISALTAATGLTDDDVLIVNDGATTKKITAANIRPYMGTVGVPFGTQIHLDGPNYWNICSSNTNIPSLNWGFKFTGTNYFQPFPVPSAITLSELSVDCITASAGHSIKMAIFSLSGSTATLVANSGVTFDVGTTGYKTVALASNVTLAPGFYVLGHATENVTPDLRSILHSDAFSFGIVSPGVNIHSDRAKFASSSGTFAAFPASTYSLTYSQGSENPAYVIGTVV